MPGVADCTLACTVQLAPAASVPPVSTSVPGLVAAALAVAVPPQVLVTVVLALTKPTGYVSLNANAVIGEPVMLVKVTVIDTGVLTAVKAVENALLTCGLAICNVPTAAAVLAPPLVLSAPIGIALLYAPPAGAFTRTVMKQILFAGMLPPTNLMPTLPAANRAPVKSVNVPPQLLTTVASTKVMFPGAPAAVLGNTSANVTDVMALAVGFDS